MEPGSCPVACLCDRGWCLMRKKRVSTRTILVPQHSSSPAMTNARPGASVLASSLNPEPSTLDTPTRASKRLQAHPRTYPPMSHLHAHMSSQVKSNGFMRDRKTLNTASHLAYMESTQEKRAPPLPTARHHPALEGRYERVTRAPHRILGGAAAQQHPTGLFHTLTRGAACPKVVPIRLDHQQERIGTARALGDTPSVAVLQQQWQLRSGSKH
eukprot:CAMPEP_0183357744 /NCGR_PEP_ID=MMETSP0164_2-20130417/47193_1 /TAXON_ID=221442 /ORGANISM="Coccolithus pelagicus ssp braarudi, Strain PLY182g" /LENGTH=212 /DNA_ID=CAMNT_0025531451 /DNA_START=119 /DNA_END=757 /DNA_ORIENTATION=+